MKRFIIHIISILTIFLGMTEALIAQPNIAQFHKSAKAALDAGNYGEAMFYYSEAVKRDSSNIELLYGLGLSSLNQYAYEKAEWALGKVYEAADDSLYAETILNLADVKLQTGKYTEASQLFDLYLSEFEKEGTPDSNRANIGSQSAKWALSQQVVSKNPLEITLLEGDINSDLSEMSAIKWNNELIFSSMRYYDKDKNQYKSKFITSADNQSIDEFKQLLREEGDPHFYSSMSIDESKGLVVFSACEYESEFEIKCHLEYCIIDASGIWGEPQQLPAGINIPLYTNTHPSIRSVNQREGILYFVSDRPGGKGGKDIWFTYFDENMSFSEPENFSALNTELDEISPFYDNLSNILYFSSNGMKGMGGYDIFYTDPEKKPVEITNLGPEINGSYHDIFYSRFFKQAYFSSNRPGSAITNEEFGNCCYDIYSVDYPYCDFEFQIADAISKEAIPYPIVLLNYDYEKLSRSDTLNPPYGLVDELELPCTGETNIQVTKEGYKTKKLELNGDSFIALDTIFLERKEHLVNVHTFEQSSKFPLDGVEVKVFRDSTLLETKYYMDRHGFSFQLIPGQTYTFLASKDGYDTELVTLELPRVLQAPYNLNMYLDKQNLELAVLTFEKVTLKPLKGVVLKVQNLSDPGTPEQMYRSLDTNDFTIYVTNHKRYRITAIKNGYEEELLEIEAEYGGKEVIRYDMYLSRLAEIESLAGLIPLSLYFDNDEPDKKNLSTRTKKNYSLSYFFYNYNLNAYKNAYTGLFKKGKERIEAEKKVEEFYENEVRKGYDNFVILLETLERVLDKGKKVNLYIRGFTSPLSYDEYNIALGKRRIDCVKNEFFLYKEGALLDYLKSGQLKLTERSFGELNSDPGVSDDPRNPVLSIYSPQAAYERRIEIDEITEIK